ncbi:Tfp pilus assembly protein FimT/FimU [Rhodopirellula sp. MGV]|uniref:pilus assembly FimT family protein n=1 Tax=Rhodopirellula sp. MGV TaxID=2023130 RepID=UPI000B95E0EC|nr:hypothetical protein [Rhodopirellula sp. MGV]OYP37277.1 hypothetical protein CGZ80_05775 [Rhodopirellula sp. MGV]PNY38050.1 hypothetical protein C2E31_04655 [Rhodopirellula baltica]
MSRHRRGISFLELTVVVLIVGLLAAIGTPRLASSMQQRSLRNAALEVADLVRYIRNAAQCDGRAISLSIDTDSNTLECYDVDHPATPGVPIELCVTTRFDSSIEMTASFDNQTTMMFDFEGMPWAGGQPLDNGTIRIAIGEITYHVVINSSRSDVTIVPAIDSPVGETGGD